MVTKTAKKKVNRKDDILRALAVMLEGKPGQRITTAKLAAEVGVSEAALYRHFPSKARMFEGLIDFIESAIFTQINLIKEQQKQTLTRIEHLLHFLLGFAEQNPGITRILTGDALLGENERLQLRIEHLFFKLESQVKQVLREKPLLDGGKLLIDEAIAANILLAYVEGRMNQFVRSQFKQKPTQNFTVQWNFFYNQLAQS
ncbi:nucleoid occlusion factor SlmA [Psychromonas antarctica]|jgi:TetR/AcrR family transcriptional regulator|uniref:nucleoid occlusion factor SlmA n=1 Tax=Psychromonas antarctica TaxID=67573 RepID=UPI001EE97EB9|nr:nucleoid occlusion factor SlmA [Psychromonas antarctica]MCG6201479.1 nucleoid occlusion factor SlmA [Psychromonas antarctica]